MNIRLNRQANPLRNSQYVIRGTSKENSGKAKYQALIQNLSKPLRLPSQENRAFRNITNLYLHNPSTRGPSEEGVLKKLHRFRNVVESHDDSQSSRSINYSFTARPPSTSTTVIVESRKEETPKKKTDPQLCEEYTAEIDEYLRTIEGKYRAKPEYMKNQSDINNTMRAILVDWLVDVHIRFKLLPETLFLTVNIIDRYLEKEQISKDKLQLVGVTAALISSKYEEIYPPEVKDFVYITDNAYTKEDILKMEQKMLHTLDFNLNVPSSNRFLQRFAKLWGSSKKTVFLAQYLLELSLVEAGMLKYLPSIQASSALYVAHKLMNGLEKWGDKMAALTKCNEKIMTPCAKDMVTMLQEVHKTTLQAVKKKFASTKFLEVSQIKICKKT